MGTMNESKPDEAQWGRLTASDRKREAYRQDLYFREAWADFAEVFPDPTLDPLADTALFVFKSDGVVGRRLRPTLDFFTRQGFVVEASAGVRHNRHSMREVWRYDWELYPTDRLSLTTLMHAATEVPLLLLRDTRYDGVVPGTVRLSDLKGSVDQEWGPDQLRSTLRPPNRVINFCHIGDEPADVVRELGIFFDRPQRLELLRGLRDSRAGAHAPGTAQAELSALVERVERESPAHEYDLDATLDRLAASGRVRPEDLTAIRRAATGVGERIRWDELVAAFPGELEGTDVWEFVLVASSVLPLERDGHKGLMPAPTGADWRAGHERRAPRPSHHGLARELGALDLTPTDAGLGDDLVVLQAERAWTRETVEPGSWDVMLPPEAVDEIRTMVDAMRRAPLQLLLREPGQFQLTACRRSMQTVKNMLTEGLGVAVLSGLPVEELTEDEATAVSWVLGQLLARPVATKWDGTMLYHVTDTGRRFGYGVRGSATNIELDFHTDNGFGVRLPDYVGLLCHWPAASGGISRFLSLYTVHNRLLAEQPELLRRLYQPVYIDRQTEHAPDVPRVLRVPIFRRTPEGRLEGRLVRGLVRRGYELMDEPMDAKLADALDAVTEIMADPALWVEFTIGRGQMQYLNNLECAHFRSEFEDGGDTARKRHLIRVWHREDGGPGYDG
jgi:hypothetical protein